MAKKKKNTAEKGSEKNLTRQIQKEMRDESFSYIKAIIFAVVAAFIIKTSVVEAYGIPSSSMEDTLLVGDLVVSNKFLYGAKLPILGYRLPAIRSPQQGDIITFKYPVDRKTDYVKRCVATAGQTVQVVNKILYVDGKAFPNPELSKYTDSLRIFPKGSGTPRDNYGPFTVPPNHVFAMGDNRDNSADSRFWGPVPIELIEGKVMFIQWSLAVDKDATKIDMVDLSTIPLSVWDTTVNFVGRIRWSRFIKFVD